MKKYIVIFINFLILISCQNPEEIKSNSSDTLFKLLDNSESGIDFTNTVINQKDFNIFKYRNYYNGGGVAIGDINNDSLPDIYFTSNTGNNKLYLNNGDLEFIDISSKAGVEGDKPWSTGVVMVDINHDGFLDIYVSNAGNMEGDNHDNDLYINNGDLTFTESAENYNIAKTGFTTHSSFFDYDKDGDLDLYILNNSNIPVTSLGYSEQRDLRAQDWKNVPKIFRGVGDMLLRNDNGRFIDVSEKAGIYGSLIGFGLGVMTSDINMDGYPDIYVSNDFYERDYLYINNQDGTFTEQIQNWTSHLSLSAMGVDIADINNDGLVDIFVTDMLPEEDSRVKSVMEFEGYNVFKLKQSKGFYQQYIQNTLQLNNGNNTFSEIAYLSGVAATDWSWAGLIFDMDNDGFRDIFVTNGIAHDLTDIDFVNFFADEIIQDMALTGRKQAIDSIINKMPIKPQSNYAFKNNKNLKFDNANEEWGFTDKTFSNGVAYGDLDNDGDLDLVINNVNMPSMIYENKSNEKGNNYIQFDISGTGKNIDAIGTVIKLYFKNSEIIQELIPSRGFQSSMDYVQTIGLGKINKIDSVRVIWPSNKSILLKNIVVNQRLYLDEKNSYKYTHEKNFKVNSLVNKIDNINFNEHKENSFLDFDYEGLISKLLSQEGPAFSIADIDNDGLDDIFIGGAKNQYSHIYKNHGNYFSLIDQKIFQNKNLYDHTASSFFDADNDGDFDLMIGVGGNEIWDSFYYYTRLYLNNGNGKFTEKKLNINTVNTNTSVIKPIDYDNDGDLDVFIGSRSVAGTYGIDPKHIFLENIGEGNFVDSTQKIIYDIYNAGMITDAKWVDINNDNYKDLITTSDWGSVNIYKNDGYQLKNVQSNLSTFKGIWEAIESSDLDGDNDMDLILGNQGENTLYRATKLNPMKMWINDFDNNGTIEQITTHNINGDDYPIHMKKELTNQIVKLKKENLKAKDYSQRKIYELFDNKVIDNSIIKELNFTKTIIAKNNGDFQFEIIELPTEIQFSCILDIKIDDLNNDGLDDIIMGGNNFEFKPQYSRQDSNYGSILINKGNMEFILMDYIESGFFINKEVKHLEIIKDKYGRRVIIAALNDGKPMLFKVNE